MKRNRIPINETKLNVFDVWKRNGDGDGNYDCESGYDHRNDLCRCGLNDDHDRDRVNNFCARSDDENFDYDFFVPLEHGQPGETFV